MSIRNEVRFWYLWIAHTLKGAFSTCERCGELGAFPCSIADCAVLCESCSIMAHVFMDRGKRGV